MTVFLLAAVGVGAAWLDLKTGRIPNWLTIGALVTFLLIDASRGRLMPGLLGAVVPAGLLLLVALLAVTGIIGAGGGDVKYAAAIGAALGPLGGLFALLVAAVLGALSALTVFRGRPAYPFAPALAAGSILSLLLWPIVASALLGR